MSKSPIVSVIVPVYKVEKYLRQCIESVINQTFSDWELLLIDDGSPDSSGGICDLYASKDPRIRVFHKINGGVSSARNVGLDNACGEWLCFLDSDDWWDPHFLEDFSLHLSGKWELVMQGYIKEDEAKGLKNKYCLPQKTFSNAAEIVSFLEMIPNFHNGYLWHRIFKRDIFDKNNIKFSEGISYAEDALVFLQYVRAVNAAIIIPKSGYHYRIVPGSLTSKFTKQSTETLHFLIEALLSNIHQIIVLNKNVLTTRLHDSIKKYGWRLLIVFVINNDIDKPEEFRKMMSYLRDLIQKYELSKIHKTTIVHRLLIFACMHGRTRISRYPIFILSRLRIREIVKEKQEINYYFK